MSKSSIDGLNEWLKWTDKLPKQVQADIAKVTSDAGNRVSSKAKNRAPVDTGRLRNSIQSDVQTGRDEVVAEISADTPYASYVEYGTYKTPAQPYLNPSLNEEARGYEDKVRKTFEEGIGS